MGVIGRFMRTRSLALLRRGIPIFTVGRPSIAELPFKSLMLCLFYRRKRIAAASVGTPNIMIEPRFFTGETQRPCVFSSSHISVAAKADRRPKARGSAKKSTGGFP
jgi:hypothetical protein